MNFSKFMELLIIDNHIMNPSVTDEITVQARRDIAVILKQYKKDRPSTMEQRQQELLKTQMNEV